MYAPFPDRGKKEVLEFAFLSTNMGKLTETKNRNSSQAKGRKKISKASQDQLKFLPRSYEDI